MKVYVNEEFLMQEGGDDDGGQQASLTFSVKMGDTWEVRLNGDSQAENLQWMPFECGISELEEEFCIFKRTGGSCPSWAPVQEGMKLIGNFARLDDSRTGGSGHGYYITICCSS
jgi:hypothetical protein